MFSISLCMITKNEEHFLENCLNSIKELVDEIIIVDTGSTDKTKDIAKKFTTKIFDFNWCNDFSKARNESLKHATKEWILILDADETISQIDHKAIKDAIKNTKNLGFSLIQRNYTNDSSSAKWISSKEDAYLESQVAKGWFPAPITRLFKNEKDIFYEGNVHESVYNSLIKKGPIKHLNIPIHHFGKLDQKKLEEKYKTYEKLNKIKAKDSTDFYAHFELGRQLVNNNKLNEAIEPLRRSIELNHNFFDSRFLLGSTLILLDKIDEALIELKSAKRLNKNNSSVYDNLGIIYSKKEEFQKAIKLFNKALEINPKNASAYKNLSQCYQKIGKTRKAKLALTKAIELNSKYKN